METCPRCGVNPADKWCRSRTDNTVLLCNDCGTAESMQDHFEGKITPQSEWPVKTEPIKEN